ncbi:hypothetical protein NAMH_0603 [Nautilia profundicola AmH]|uniref:Uncharacterized protein n=1 Tax=Nautilia profundicola (strain ATCC BAA-1463 / DSM 18972 / AmH) TaxID=598659 RepID=B9L8R1_NAUPA|nr:hypothetical protein NAMH_0603 [Nautilia profundicola AmH]
MKKYKNLQTKFIQQLVQILDIAKKLKSTNGKHPTGKCAFFNAFFSLKFAVVS